MTVSVGLEHDAIGVGRDDRRGFLRSHLILGGLRASADEADDLYVTQVGASPLANGSRPGSAGKALTAQAPPR